MEAIETMQVPLATPPPPNRFQKAFIYLVAFPMIAWGVLLAFRPDMRQKLAEKRQQAKQPSQQEQA